MRKSQRIWTVRGTRVGRCFGTKRRALALPCRGSVVSSGHGGLGWRLGRHRDGLGGLSPEDNLIAVQR